MRLTAFSDYTLRVLMYLAIEPGKLATIPEIAAAYAISENHLMKVVQHLAREGLVESTRGRGGGIRLARAPESIRIGAVLRAAEGDEAIVPCLGDPPGACCIFPVCELKGLLVDAFDALYATLDEHTLADLVHRPRGLARALRPGEAKAVPLTRRAR